MKRFGEVIKQRRRFLGLTMEAVGKKSGTHKGYICGIEKGTVNPPAPGMTAKIARVLKLPADPLLYMAWVEKAPRKIRSKLDEVIGEFVFRDWPEVA